MEVNKERIPQQLTERPQWVLWKTAARTAGDKPTKLPYQVSGDLAKANDAGTWATFDAVWAVYEKVAYSGIGYEFSTDDPFAGIDLDGCRDPQTGKVAEWAREIILKFASYAEVSPSETGVKIFCIANWGAKGKKVSVDAEKVCDKAPGIEIYDRERYFAVTGWRLAGPAEPMPAEEALAWLKAKYLPDAPAKVHADFHSQDAIVDRARKYLAKLPPSVSGQSGHKAAFHAACVLCLGFELSEADALGLMQEFNQRCTPPWSERELQHKVSQAMKQPGSRGYLRNTAPERWGHVSVPQYREQPEALKAEPRVTTLVDAADEYLQSIRDGKAKLIDLGLPDLTYAVGGGVEAGEMVIFAARPSHGKSAMALQCVHYWTELGMPCAVVSEEMSKLALGKRTIQHITEIRDEWWHERIDDLAKQLQAYAEARKRCIVIEGCGGAYAAAEQIEKAVKDHGVQCAVVDYAQLLRSPGKSRYEQQTNTSIVLRQLASSQKIVLLVLCQLGREVEKRPAFSPVMSDLKDTGQFEQDADVIAFLCWPWRIDDKRPRDEFQFIISKNRNRPINQRIVTCRFAPDRQKFSDPVSAAPQRVSDWTERD
jgi:DnaB-like helicase C terminal domain